MKPSHMSAIRSNWQCFNTGESAEKKWDIALFIACSVHHSRMTFVARGSELMLPKKLPRKKVADCQVMSAVSRYINKVAEWWGLAATGTSTPSGSGIIIRPLASFSHAVYFKPSKTGKHMKNIHKLWHWAFFSFKILKSSTPFKIEINNRFRTKV